MEAAACDGSESAPPAADASAHVAFLPLDDADKHARMVERRRWRLQIETLPTGPFFELPGRPHVCYCVRHYGHEDFGSKEQGAKRAREDFGYMFKAFESGQTPPHRLKKQEGMQHQPTIHEYLDWTVTAAEGKDPEDTCFAGFRVVMLFQRHRPEYPPPNTYDSGAPPALDGLGAGKSPMPRIMPKGTKPLSVATVRCGDSYIEVPFFATAENHRGKGYGRCLLEALEQIGRRLHMDRFLLCSTDDDKVRSMWCAMGFSFTAPQHCSEWDIRTGDLIYMTNTVQMHKEMPPARSFRCVRLRHGAYDQRLYAPLDVPKGCGVQLLREAELARKRKRAPSKSPPKKAPPVKKAPRASGKVHVQSGVVAAGVVGHAARPSPALAMAK